MTTRVIQDISGYLTIYSGTAFTIAVVFASIKFVCTLCYRVSQKQGVYGRIWWRTLMSLPVDFMAVFYAYMVVAITFFSRMEGSTDIVNLRLFSTFADNLQAKIFIVENIMMFIPLGCFLWWYGARRYRMVLPVSIMTSVVIEMAQWLTGRGKAEIDDVLTNTLGAVIGFTVMKVLSSVIAMIRKRIKKQ